MHNAKQNVKVSSSHAQDSLQILNWSFSCNDLDKGQQYLNLIRTAFKEISHKLGLANTASSTSDISVGEIVFDSGKGYRITFHDDPTKLNNFCVSNEESYGSFPVGDSVIPMVSLWYVAYQLWDTGLGILQFCGDDDDNAEIIAAFSDLKPWMSYVGADYEYWLKLAERLDLVPSFHSFIKPCTEVSHYF